MTVQCKLLPCYSISFPEHSCLGLICFDENKYKREIKRETVDRKRKMGEFLQLSEFQPSPKNKM